MADQQATIFEPGLVLDDNLHVTWIEGDLLDAGARHRRQIISRLRILSGGSLPGVMALPWQLLSIKLFGRYWLVRSLCRKIFKDLARAESRMVADHDAPEPLGWASIAERSELQSTTLPAKAPPRPRRI